MGSRTSANSIFKKSDVPGPGTYRPGNIFTSPKYTIKGKYSMGTALVANTDGTHEKVATVHDSQVPGPGTYSARLESVHASLSTKFGT